jgi:tetratricopeptide (TPR) repeat protein
MPQAKSRSVDHIAFTDHSIPRHHAAKDTQAGGPIELKPFWPSTPPDARDLALAYATLAPTQPSLRRRAFELLQQAEAANPSDVPVLSQLALFNDRMGREDAAMALSERILKLDPTHTAASINLGIYKIKRGQANEAIALWRKALERNPAQPGSAMNLAVALQRSGDSKGAIATLQKILDLEPDLEPARRLLAEIEASR